MIETLKNLLSPERRRVNQEIKELEEKLGLSGRNLKTLYYDPYYTNNESYPTRESYLEELRSIGKEDEDVIPILETWYIQTRISGNFPVNVGFLLKKGLFELPEGIHIGKIISYEKVKLSTLSKCGNLDNYDFIRFSELDYTRWNNDNSEEKINEVKQNILLNWRKNDNW